MSFFRERTETLAHFAVTALARRQETLATAESCTGGLLAKYITDQAGASSVFGTGLVTYANEAKIALLGISENLLAQYGAVSEAVAQAMAEGVRKVAKSTVGIGITGIAGPGGGSVEKPLGLVYIALATERETQIECLQPEKIYRGRIWVREKTVNLALQLLKTYLVNHC